MPVRAVLVAFLALLAPGLAAAQSFDCTKARTPQEKAICAQPGLGALDRSLAETFAAAVARAGDGGAGLRTAETAWLRDRDAQCKDPVRMTACLSAAMTARIAALSPPAPAGQAQGGQAQGGQASGGQASGGQASAGQAAAGGQTQVQLTPAPRPPTPVAIPSAFNPPPAAATLDRTTLPATAPGDTLLHVAVPGRFAIAARSASGTALQLVDMMAGPSAVVGEAGVHDGRTDVLLDVGTYKLRVLPAEHATGDVALTVTPFRDARPPAATPGPGEMVSASLGDGQQASFWTSVGPDGRVEVDAAGRALADLRLWRGGTDLEPVEPQSRVVEATKGHPMLRLRLSGTVEPGTYLVTAYGGPPLGWADGTPGTPFFLRAGASRQLRDGWAAGTVGPMGSEVFEAPPRAGLFRLTLPSPAAAALLVDDRAATIAANSRDPVAIISTGPGRLVVEVAGLAGQPFRLRADEESDLQELTKPGRYWVSAVLSGAGGDEVPPTALLLSDDGKSPPRVLASTAPRVGPQAPWRAQFNVRGPTTLTLQNVASGELTVRNASQNLATLHWQPRSTNLPADFADYLVAPPDGQQGVVDLTFGGGNATTPAAVAKWPADPAVPFGVQTVEPGRKLVLDLNEAPLLSGGLVARPVPVALAEGPLTIAQMPGVALDVPVRVAPGGSLAVADPETGAGIPVAFRPAPDGSGTVSLPAPSAPRVVVLAWRTDAAAAPRAPIPPPPRRADVPAVAAGTPRFLDLRSDEQRRFDLVVGEGGLYRLETLGRLHTGLELGTAFTPRLDAAEANGVGENALLQRWLRAGRYRVGVHAMKSAGHLGLRAVPAPLADGAPLLPGGVVRATLPAGAGLSVPVTIAAAGRYRLELQGLGRTFNARLDDADGWPLTAPGPLDTLDRTFAPGNDRLLIAPEAVDAPLAARLTAVLDPQPIEGHGPHPLPLDAKADATWREPAGRGDPRTPDDWTFTLAGPAQATLRISNGMVASVERDGAAAPVARVAGPAPAKLQLPAGSYHLHVTSLGRNDRLGYTVSLDTVELQPGVPRTVKADATVPFTLAAPHVVSLTSWGQTPLRAVLRSVLPDGTDRVVGRYGNQGSDWNLAVSRALPAGSYRLDLSPATPPDMTDAPAPSDPPSPPDLMPMPAAANPANGNADAPADGDDADNSTQPAADPGEPLPQSSGPSGAASGAAAPDADSSDAAAPDGSGDAASSADPAQAASDADTAANAAPKPTPAVELTLSLPPEHDAVAAPAGPVTLAEGGVHRLTLPVVREGQLVLASASSAAPLVLSLERRDTAGAWAEVAQDTGLSPVVALDGAPGDWRLAVWPVDGGSLPVTASAAVIDSQVQDLGALTLRPAGGTAVPVFVAAVQPDAPGPVALGPVAMGEAPGVLAGGWPGHALTAPSGGMALPQGGPVWVVARAAVPISASRVLAAPGQATVLAIPPGAVAQLAAPPPRAGVFRAWRADSGLGQPGLDAGAGMGVAPGSALAAGTAPVRIWDAGRGDDVLRPRVTPLDLLVQPSQTLTAAGTLLLPPMSATLVTLPAGARRTDLSLAPGLAAVAGRGSAAVTVWTGEAADARSLGGEWTDLTLLNTGASPAPATVAWTPGVPDPVLRPGAVLKRFFGASGSFDVDVDVPADAPAGTRLLLVGDARMTFTGADGRVREGARLAPGGRGRLTVAHAPGPLAVWLDVPGASPWPAAAPQPRPLPGLVALSGPAMALSLPVPAPVLLHARSTAPVILRLDDGPPVLYPAGAFLSRYVARDAVLHVDSPHDGPLSGTLELTADPVVPAGDGPGVPVALAPGDAVAFAFQVPAAATVGVGVRADPDRVETRMLAADGTVLGEGAALLRPLPPGRYLLEVSLPPDAPAAVVRAAVVGTVPRPSGPPPDVVNHYLELVGLAPKDAAR